ncbi:hypothetical protein L484_022954 [Morus notabilis]|uniref:Uncharacterized protein n=1 Tax=Morus notabilis TaxID=981085 RepID=W9R1F2_9ROSA|nr:hypothetical protein L484_022954 [Morus notabilis]
MDFFKFIFADEPLEPSDSDEPQNDDTPAPELPPDSNSSTAWSFGGLIKTLATKFEPVIQTYRKDLEEFGSGLRMETTVIRDAASRAVRDLPASLEVVATIVALIGRDSLLAAADEDSDAFGWSRQLVPNSVDHENFWFIFASFLSPPFLSLHSATDEDSDTFGWSRPLVPKSVDHENFWFRFGESRSLSAAAETELARTSGALSPCLCDGPPDLRRTRDILSLFTATRRICTGSDKISADDSISVTSGGSDRCGEDLEIVAKISTIVNNLLQAVQHCQVLSDDKKRALYDQYGEAGVKNRVGGGSSAYTIMAGGRSETCRGQCNLAGYGWRQVRDLSAVGVICQVMNQPAGLAGISYNLPMGH